MSVEEKRVNEFYLSGNATARTLDRFQIATEQAASSSGPTTYASGFAVTRTSSLLISGFVMSPINTFTYPYSTFRSTRTCMRSFGTPSLATRYTIQFRDASSYPIHEKATREALSRRVQRTVNMKPTFAPFIVHGLEALRRTLTPWRIVLGVML